MSGKRVLSITLYDRTPQVITSMFNSLLFPGNRVDAIAVCYDRAPRKSVDLLRNLCAKNRIELRESFLDDDEVGSRCPAAAYNKSLGLVSESHVFCLSSDIVLAPHSIGMAYELSRVCPDDAIIGMVTHCGPSYYWDCGGRRQRIQTSSENPMPMGFCWLIPMDRVRQLGGYDEIYMGGLCFEDDDFVRRLWMTGINFIFCDDISGSHIEHDREHCVKNDGRVQRNRKIHQSRHSESPDFSDVFPGSGHVYLSGTNMLDYCVGMSMLVRKIEDANDATVKLSEAQRMYGYSEPWLAFRGLELP